MTASINAIAAPSVGISLNVKLGGGGEIRTREALSGLEVFKTSALDRYATPPVCFTIVMVAKNDKGVHAPRASARRVLCFPHAIFGH